jgi:purine nucleosidase
VRRILLDTDLAMGEPGADIDDGLALAFALADPELSVELVTTVNGNTDVDTATRLTRQLLERLGRGDVPLARGAATPLVGDWTRGGGRLVERVDAPVPGHAALSIVERVMAEPGELSVVAIGPLTNVALALALEPQVATSIAEIVVMGGVYLEQTNVAAIPGEFNFWVDPHAAAEVLASGAPIRAVGLDVTRRVRLTREHVAWLAESAGDFGRFAAACAEGWIAHLEQTTDQRGSCALHDPLAVASVCHPDLVAWRPARVAVETCGAHTRGVAVADLLTTPHAGPANCRIAVGVDAPAFLDLFLGRIATLG